MGYGVMDVLGYHGFELRAYDELGGKSSGWQNVLSPNFMRLLAVRFLILNDTASVPGFHQVVPPTTTAVGHPAVLYEKDSVPAYARVMPTAAKLPDGQDLTALLDPRFPVDRVALYPDTSSVVADPIVQPFPSSAVQVSPSRWAPGRMTLSFTGADSKNGHLVVSENWYPDWHATVDGKAAVVRRADHSLLSVDVPAGAKQVELWFDSATYARGKLLSVAGLLAAVVMIGVALMRRRPVAA